MGPKFLAISFIVYYIVEYSLREKIYWKDNLCSPKVNIEKLSSLIFLKLKMLPIKNKITCWFA